MIEIEEEGLMIGRREVMAGGAAIGALVLSSSVHGAEAAAGVGAALASFILNNRTASLPDSIRELARLHVLDTIVSAMACRELEPSRLARAFARTQGSGRSTIMGTGERTSLIEAAFAGAMIANAAEINDFIPSAFVHPGPAVLATALAVAELKGASGDQVLRATVAGYELAGRIPKALGLSQLTGAGMSSHAIGALFGSATAAASLLDLDAQQIGHMFAYCAEEAAGSMQWLLDVEHIEKSFVFAGRGARAGLSAALMAQAGWRGTRDAFDAPGGWMRSAPFDGGDAGTRRAALTADLGTRFELSGAAFKRYPVGGPTQPAIAGMLALLPKIDRNAVASVRIEMPGRADAFRDAQMPALNLRYTSALVLLDGRLDFVHVQSRERFLNDGAAHALMNRIDVVHDAAQEPKPGEAREESARVTITQTDGSRQEIFVPRVLGYPSHPMTRVDVEQKAAGLLAPRAAHLIAEIIGRAGHPDRLSRAATLLDIAAR
jgi:2-methylcitrate dehydratase PrpD